MLTTKQKAEAENLIKTKTNQQGQTILNLFATLKVQEDFYEDAFNTCEHFAKQSREKAQALHVAIHEAYKAGKNGFKSPKYDEDKAEIVKLDQLAKAYKVQALAYIVNMKALSRSLCNFAAWLSVGVLKLTYSRNQVSDFMDILNTLIGCNHHFGQFGNNMNISFSTIWTFANYSMRYNPEDKDLEEQSATPAIITTEQFAQALAIREAVLKEINEKLDSADKQIESLSHDITLSLHEVKMAVYGASNVYGL